MVVVVVVVLASASRLACSKRIWSGGGGPPAQSPGTAGDTQVAYAGARARRRRRRRRGRALHSRGGGGDGSVPFRSGARPRTGGPAAVVESVIADTSVQRRLRPWTMVWVGWVADAERVNDADAPLLAGRRRPGARPGRGPMARRARPHPFRTRGGPESAGRTHGGAVTGAFCDAARVRRCRRAPGTSSLGYCGWLTGLSSVDRCSSSKRSSSVRRCLGVSFGCGKQSV